MMGYCVFECKKIGLKRDLRCINPCKYGDGSYLKKIDLLTQGGEEVNLGGRSGNFRGSKNQKCGKCHELSRKSITFVFTHPTRGGFQRGGGWGSTFQKSGKFHELSRKSIKKIPPPPPPKGVAGGILGGQKIKSPGNVMNCREK